VNALLIAGWNDRLNADYFNLAGVRPVPLEEFVKILLKAAGGGSYRIVPFPPEKKAIDIGSVYSSAAKFNAASGWTARVSIEEGLPPTLEYYRKNRSKYW
jgi:UDP-glucose 4-epimerase